MATDLLNRGLVEVELSEENKKFLEDAVYIYAPVTGFLLRNGLEYELNTIGKMVLEYETLSDPGEAYLDDAHGMGEGLKDEPIFEVIGLPLPICFTEFDSISDLRKATESVLNKVEEEVVKELKKQGIKVKDILGAQKTLYGTHYYGPYLVIGDMLIQLTANVVRIVINKPKVYGLQDGRYRVETIIVADVRRDYNKKTGIAYWEGK